ncbi:adenylate/guanylate cyclase domain-containing protein [Maribacter polysaccharolyticus]|uniref:adenylate/guanylate cyclase domain-containing protein n=1 Tax=Maribacter polysaccharolyticus TaxID=3020831 RepID=UPI00237FCC85|nr:adenylate/guanylate cyclase domain-containing protein [Maribacter polysaccharolyticus]MDE3740472.1 adenylate/guanylate cyclase domain-containing protein [Maribacter polysaccharolyticus]
MDIRTKRQWIVIRDYMIGWTIAFLFLAIIRGIGTIEKSSLYFEFEEALIFSFIFGPFFGGISGLAQNLLEKRYNQRVSIYRLIGLRLLYALLFLFFLIFMAYLMVGHFYGKTEDFLAFAFGPGSIPIYLYILTVDTLMLLTRQVNLMLGDNNLKKLLMGKFYNPREEERIFMFLDLQSSTTHAEHLGHLTYSRMIQDCFNDLGMVIENEAEIYQYVGDEVILTWELKKGLRNQNCLKAFYTFQQRLHKKKGHYLAKYNCLPFFKAGLHSGKITVTEVGKYKKEIAYHGDTINTTARIQGQCNTLNQELLISQQLKEQLMTNGYDFKNMGSIPLRGKEKEVIVFGVTPTIPK